MTKHIQKLFLLLAPALVMWGCSNANPDAPALRDGQHPPNWVSQHGDEFLQNPDQCRTCHGDTLTEGGISQVSCASVQFRLPNGEVVLCHGGAGAEAEEEAGPFGHPIDGFVSLHQTFVKGAPQMNPASPLGFEECTDCHGGNFAGTTMPGATEGSTTSPYNCNTACHSIQAPHSPPVDWETNHQQTDPGNGEACGVCHAVVENPPETPGCFNSFLCHNAVPAPHPVPWAAHGTAAIDAPVAGQPQGLLSCNGCHGSKFSNNAGNGADACVTCHGINAPHPTEDVWETQHQAMTGAGEANAVVCAWCHPRTAEDRSGATNLGQAAPGCFNNTLCHGPDGPAD